MLNPSRLGLGTAQWGMNYGIKNLDGKPSLSEIENILIYAKQIGILTLDTAFSYGNAEEILGSLVHITKGFRIITKTLSISKARPFHNDIKHVLKAFQESLEKNRQKKVYGLLVHHSQDLLTEKGPLLWDALLELKEFSLIQKLGVSVYEPSELEAILSRYKLDIVQLPLSIYDQRFSNTGLLKTCKNLGIEIHSRSCFLQGLLLIDSPNLPSWCNSIKNVQRELHNLIKASGFSILEACLKFCLSQPEVETVIVGFEKLSQLKELVFALRGELIDQNLFHSYGLDDDNIVNPSRWPV